MPTPTFVIELTNRDYGKAGQPHAERMRAHFTERGVGAKSFYGIDGPRLTVETTRSIDPPRDNFKMGQVPTGIWLSHRALWAALYLQPPEVGDRFLVLESDAQFPPNWRERLTAAMGHAGDFDVLFIGSCCTDGRPRLHVGGDVYEVRYPMCTHAYIVHRRALHTMMCAVDSIGCHAPIDMTMAHHTLAKLGRVLTVLPRIVDQFNTELLP